MMLLRTVILCLLTCLLARGRRHAGDKTPAPNIRLDLSPGQLQQLRALKPKIFYYSCHGSSINSAALASDGFITLIPESALFDEKLDCDEDSQRWSDESSLGMNYVPPLDEEKLIVARRHQQTDNLEPDHDDDETKTEPSAPLPVSENGWKSIVCEVILQILANRVTELVLGLLILTKSGQKSKCDARVRLFGFGLPDLHHTLT